MRALFLCLLIGLLTWGQPLIARDFEAGTKVLLQVSDKDPALFKRVLTNAVNLIKHYGMDEVQVEIATYAGGVYLLEEGGKEAQRVKDLMIQGVEFSACGFTLDSLKRGKQKPPKMLSGVQVVPFGLPHIVERQKQGYIYLRP